MGTLPTKDMSDNTHRAAWVREMPKVELHLHLEGAFTLETLLRLIRKHEPSTSLRSVDDLRGRFIYADFSGFIDTWNWKNGYFRAGQDFELSAYHTLEALSRQNVLYVEPFFSPWDFRNNGPGMEEITESILAGCVRANRDFGIQWNLIADINREHGPEEGMSRIEQVLRYRDRGVIGIGLGGREKEFPAGAFADVYARAARHNLLLTAHAGEADGPASIWAALDGLHVHRIGHGIRACEDDSLVAALAERRVPLEVCVTSNVKTGVVPSLALHPVRTLFERQLCITINSDDPTMFDCSVTGEYLLLLDHLGFSIADIKTLSLNGVLASALDVSAKHRLSSRFEEYWTHYV
jgi:adenosine deaminase